MSSSSDVVPYSQPTILLRVKKALRVWWKDFGVPEAVTISGISILGIAFQAMEVKNINLLAILGDLGEYFLFLGTLMVQTMARSGGSARKAIGEVLILTPAEVIDIFSRPIFYAVMLNLIENKMIGMAASKISADIFFYPMVYAIRRYVDLAPFQRKSCSIFPHHPISSTN